MELLHVLKKIDVSILEFGKLIMIRGDLRVDFCNNNAMDKNGTSPEKSLVVLLGLEKSDLEWLKVMHTPDSC